MRLIGSQLPGNPSTHSFLVCGISNALDGSEDDLASSDIPEIREQEDDGESSADHPDEEIDHFSFSADEDPFPGDEETL